MRNQKKIAIVLGGTSPHIGLIKNLKSRGYYTILIDYYENPPAKDSANEHIQESTLDKKVVLRIAEEKNADLVICTSIDQANVTACFVSEQLGLPRPYSHETALKVTDKVLMKDIMTANQIPTSRYLYLNESPDFTSIDLDYPLVVKPSDSNGSLGVRKVDNIQQLKSAFNKAMQISRNKKVVIEEFKAGKEVSLDCFVKNGVSIIIQIRERFKIKDNGDDVIQSQGSYTPGDITSEQQAKLNEISNLIVKAFNLNNTSLLIQAIVSDDDISILEFAPRISGGLSFKTAKMNTGFDFIDGTIDSYLGNDILVDFHEPAQFISSNIVYARQGVFNEVLGIDKLQDQHIIEEFYYYKTKGMKIPGDLSTKSRIGAFIVKGNTKGEMFEKMKIACEALDVVDFDGQSLMKKGVHMEVMNA